MSRLNKLDEILKSYEGRNYEKAPGYKNNFCMVFEEMGEYLSYVIHGKSKPKSFNEATK